MNLCTRATLRRLMVLAVVLATLAVTRPGTAEDATVPIVLEAQLLAKVAGYDKHLGERAGDKVHILILTKPGNDDSTRAAAQMQTALASIGPIGALPHDETLLPYAGAKPLADVLRARRTSILFITPGFGAEIEAIRTALDGADVLTVSAIADYVPKGIVLGFDLVSGKPKLLAHLTQAKKQHVNLAADVLKLMKVYE